MSWFDPDASINEKLKGGQYCGPDGEEIGHWAIGAVNLEEKVVTTFPVMFDFIRPVPLAELEEMMFCPYELETHYCRTGYALLGRVVLRPLEFFRRFYSPEPWDRFDDPKAMMDRWAWLIYGH